MEGERLDLVSCVLALAFVVERLVSIPLGEWAALRPQVQMVLQELELLAAEEGRDVSDGT